MSGRFRRLVSLATTACCAVALVAGCASTTSAYNSATVRRRVATHVIDIANAYGLPIQYDFVGCNGPNIRGKITCVGVRAAEPQRTVSATFSPDRGCQGTLTVEIGTTTLAARRIDPCR